MKTFNIWLYALPVVLLVFLSAPLGTPRYGAPASKLRGLNYLVPAAAATTTQPDFSLSVSPTSQTVLQGDSTSYTVTITPSQGFAGIVHLAIDDLPPSVSAQFTTRNVKSSGYSTITVTTKKPTPLGDYRVLISATYREGLVHRAIVRLIVGS